MVIAYICGDNNIYMHLPTYYGITIYDDENSYYIYTRAGEVRYKKKGDLIKHIQALSYEERDEIIEFNLLEKKTFLAECCVCGNIFESIDFICTHFKI